MKVLNVGLIGERNMRIDSVVFILLLGQVLVPTAAVAGYRCLGACISTFELDYGVNEGRNVLMRRLNDQRGYGESKEDAYRALRAKCFAKLDIWVDDHVVDIDVVSHYSATLVSTDGYGYYGVAGSATETKDLYIMTYRKHIDLDDDCGPSAYSQGAPEKQSKEKLAIAKTPNHSPVNGSSGEKVQLSDASVKMQGDVGTVGEPD